MAHEERSAARLALVEEHIGAENAHDVDAILATYGAEPRYDDEPWDEHYVGHAEIRGYYEQLLAAAPDLHVDVEAAHAAAGAVVLEATLGATHLGPWRGLPATGRRVGFPLCVVYAFDEEDRIARERAYYDRATVLHQLGVFHDPTSALGRVVTPVVHPVTIGRVLARKASTAARSRG